MKLTLAAGFAAIVAGSFAIAQDASLVGKYSGNYASDRSKDNPVVLTIESVENGVVKGSVLRATTGARGGRCSGTYPVEGTVKDGTLSVRSTATSGRGEECNFFFSGSVDGNKLVGRIGQNSATLSK